MIARKGAISSDDLVPFRLVHQLYNSSIFFGEGFYQSAESNLLFSL
jgi:hypothetical protein